ncbi:MAG TPA: hypothetical protein VIQ30_22730 [Pseudonocardia sp.]
MATPVPNRPIAKNRGIRVTDEVWDAAKAAAHENGEYLSEAITAFLIKYVADSERKQRAKKA